MRKSLLIMFLLFAAGITANAQKFALIDMEYIPVSYTHLTLPTT